MRAPLLKTYRQQIGKFIERMYGVTKDQADAISMDICTEHYKPLTAIIEETKIDGKPEIKAVDLAPYFDSHSNNLMSVSGSIYMQHTQKLSKTIEMTLDLKSDRKREKKEQFKAKAAGNESESLEHYYRQTSIKITMNSLPGNYGSPYSVFYSKANYNAITSCGRALIGYAYSEIESVLGGNFAWFSKDELKQHIFAHLTKGVDCDKVRTVMTKYNLKWVDRQQLFEFYQGVLAKYHKYENYFDIAAIISKLSDEEVQFFYYFQNLRHILMENDAVFRPWIKDLFDMDKVPIFECAPEDLNKIDGDLVTLCNVTYHKYIDPGDSKIQVYDLPKERPDLARKFVCIAKYVEDKLASVQDIFDVFVYTPINRSNVQARKMMYRNSAVISDTDSVIFTVKDWVAWYTGNVYDYSDMAYHITFLMIYWIQKAVAQCLYIYSQAHGAQGEFAKVMAMKNEFFYPVIVLADVKKHYAGIVTVQEGVILPTPDIDIKGVQFKGSDICKPATEFAKNFIEIEGLTNMYKHGRISGHELIDKIRTFEQRIRNDIEAGKADWLEALALRPKNDYANPMSSNWYYFYAWQSIFADKYGEISVPTKAPAVQINKPDAHYFEWLSKTNKSIYQKFKKFIETNKRVPPKFVINPVSGTIPRELIPLVKITDIVHHNVRPIHLFLKQIGISCGHEDDKLLFSDVYPITETKNKKE